MPDPSPIELLIAKGVKIPSPESVIIGDEVDLDRISGEEVTIYPGTKIMGKSVLVCAGTCLGLEAPTTVVDCQIGPDVSLAGGYFKNAVFLEKSSMGSGAHVRDGTILEEQASGAHTVGLKQTILFPFVTLGSLINFCDCLMSGGTSRKNHSEVGSSFIHFNYTPNQDKATASLIGDVPHGVMLNQRPIFLGGQGGLVGPCRLTHGNVTAAGTIWRKDELRPDRLLVAATGKNMNIAYRPGSLTNLKKILTNNLFYIANLLALGQWYVHVRARFISERFPEQLHLGLLDKISMAVRERIGRLEDFIIRAVDSEQASGQKSRNADHPARELRDRWANVKPILEFAAQHDRPFQTRDIFLAHLEKAIAKKGKHYIRVVKSLDPAASQTGTGWLREVVDTIMAEAMSHGPYSDNHGR